MIKKYKSLITEGHEETTKGEKFTSNIWWGRDLGSLSGDVVTVAEEDFRYYPIPKLSKRAVRLSSAR